MTPSLKRILTGTRLEQRAELRVREKLFLGYVVFATMATFSFQVDGRQRVAVLALNLLVGGVIYLLSCYGAPGNSLFLSKLRDWVPCVLILVAYRESGLFFVPDPTHRLDYLFIRWDNVLLKNAGVLRALEICSPWLQHYLEFSYFLCYPIVPLGLTALYVAGQHAVKVQTRAQESSPAPASRDALEPEQTVTPEAGTVAAVSDRRADLGVIHAKASQVDCGSETAPADHRTCVEDRRIEVAVIDRRYRAAIKHCWTAVLLAALACYVLYPFFPLTPPRELFRDLPGPGVAPLLRDLNHWLLGRYAVGASLFPSGHVAAVTAVALVVRHYLPRVGILFLTAAASVAVATVYGRYHYVADAIAGALVGVSAYLVASWLEKS